MKGRANNPEQFKRRLRETWDKKMKNGFVCWNKGKKGFNANEKSGMWKGDKACKGSIHDWVKARKKKPELCEECKNKPPRDLANISQEYKRDINDFKWMCHSCHQKLDHKLEVRTFVPCKRGEENHLHKITENQAREVKKLLANGLGAWEIGRRLNISHRITEHIARGETRNMETYLKYLEIRTENGAWR
jgi:hypothetical protein